MTPRRRTACALALAGCGLPAAPTPNTLGQWCLDHSCVYEPGVVSPDEGHEALVQTAVDSLVTQTGVALRVGAGGVPVRFVPEVFGVDDVSVCGVTDVGLIGDIVVSLDVAIAVERLDGCEPLWLVVRHELGCHVLHPRSPHTPTGACAEAPSGSGAVLDDVSQAFVAGDAP